MSNITQDERFLAITDFSLGKDTFLLSDFEGREKISTLFSFEINVLSENHNIAAEDIIGKSGTMTVNSQVKRYFHGHIVSFSRCQARGKNLRHYQLVMVPWLWFLSKTNNHRIFQEKNTKDIVTQIFKDYGFNDFDFRAQGGTTREYCVQHNQSDFEFISSLLEEEGIAYYFKHEEGKHTLILVDKKNAYEACEESEVEFVSGSHTKMRISGWKHNHSIRKGKWSMTDYNYETPDRSLLVSTKTISRFTDNEKYEHYEYPGLYHPGIGNELVKIRQEAEEVEKEIITGESDCVSFYAGGTFKLTAHAVAEEKGDYILLEVTHKAEDKSHNVDAEDTGTHYSNEFLCFPSTTHYRPPRRHIRSKMRGPQSAVVTGPAGEEIYFDEYGRIKVQFIWDREGKKDENTSCWIRVAQIWAGNQWGAHFIPRIGHEVIVSFLDGDPDRPIVTGTVYNDKHKPPYKPQEKTQSGIKTRSSKEGSKEHFNELRFDDKKGSEQIYIHAEKNMDTVIENNETLTIYNNRTKEVKNNENASIGNDRSKSVGNNQTESIGVNKSISVGSNHQESIGQSKTLSVGVNHTESIGKTCTIDIGKDKNITVAENHTESIDKDMSISISKDLEETVGGKYTEDVAKEYALRAKSITMEADDQITLKTGSAKIVMKKNGDITISGKNINVKGSGNVVLKGSKVTSN